MPRPAPRAYLLWPLAALVAAIALARGLALAWAESRPTDALRAWPTAPEAVISRAAGPAAQPADMSRERLVRALHARPLDGRAWRAQAQDAGGHAGRLHQQAIRVTPRDAASRAWLGDRAYAVGDAATALAHVDAMLQSETALYEPLFEHLARASSDREVRLALVATLHRQPGWRPVFIGWWARRAQAGDAFLATTTAIASSATAGERIDHVVGRLQRARPAAAYVAWMQAVQGRWPSSLRVEAGPLGTPDGDEAAFGWQAPDAPGWGADPVAAPEAGVLSLGFTGAAAVGAGPRQRLLLPPGRHRVSVGYRLDALRTPRGLRWSVRCEGGAGDAGAGALLRGDSRGWRVQEWTVVVPPTGCASQWLVLDVDGAARLDRRIEGGAWFARWTIVPEGAAAPRTPAALARSPVAWVLAAAPDAALQRGPARHPLRAGDLLVPGDQVEGRATLVWDDGCQASASRPIATVSPCAGGRASAGTRPLSRHADLARRVADTRRPALRRIGP